MRIKQLLPHVGTAFVAGIAGVAIGSSAAAGTVETVAAPAPPPVVITETVQAPPPPVSIPEPPAAPADAVPAEEEVQAASGTIPGDGIFIVGTDIEPGTYRTTGPAGGESWQMCYSARLSGLSGELDDIITNDISKGPKTVQVASSDEAFDTSGCSAWELVK